jgi:hypothetical protein
VEPSSAFLGDVVYVEHDIGEMIYDGPSQVGRYQRAFDMFRASAESPQRSSTWLEREMAGG